MKINGYMRIFGKVKIGNNVKTHPYSIIYENKPNNYIVTVKNNKQYIKRVR